MKKAPPHWQKHLEDAVSEWLIHGGDDSSHPYATRMTALVKSFPCLAAKRLPGTEPWNVCAFAEAAFLKGGLSHGERLAAAFILKVWNTDFPCPKFDFFDAMTTWDTGNRAAFLRWAADPFWP